MTAPLLRGVRKLATAIAAISGIVALYIVLAAIRPELANTYTTSLAIGAIAGIGGFNIWQQTRIDQSPQ